jgi:protein-disulfide isomerase
MAETLKAPLPIGPRDHTSGPEGAPVTLVEYGDFQCPHCEMAYPAIKELQQRFAGKLRFVFRHFPLTNAHPQAQAAAEASEWAAQHGGFWQMHDILYEHQSQLSEAYYLKVADELKLDRAALARALKEHTYFKRVKEDFLSGLAGGVKGTPAFFVNDVRHQGDWDELVETIERAAG